MSGASLASRAIKGPWRARTAFGLAAAFGLALLTLFSQLGPSAQAWLPNFGVRLRPEAGLVAALGLCFAGGSLLQLLRFDGQAPITGGLFRWARHPMYLGQVLLYLAWGLMLGTSAMLLSTLPLLWMLNRFVLPAEEAELHAVFGEAYGAYAARVGRWLPWTWTRAKPKA